MKVVSWSELRAAGLLDIPASLAIGVFDGVHRGHQALVEAIIGNNTTAVVVTFSRHPAVELGTHFPGFLMTTEQKRETLADVGVEIAVEIAFDAEFSRITGGEFLAALADVFDLQHVVVGYDFRCGSDALGAGGVKETLEDGGVAVDIVPAQTYGGSVVSSTAIRRHIRVGEITSAVDLLGRPYTLDLRGAGTNREHGRWVCPLAQEGTLQDTRQIVPAPGIFPVMVVTDNEMAHGTLTIEESFMSLPLAPTDPIRYIVLQENGLMEQGD